MTGIVSLTQGSPDHIAVLQRRDLLRTTHGTVFFFFYRMLYSFPERESYFSLDSVNCVNLHGGVTPGIGARESPIPRRKVLA